MLTTYQRYYPRENLWNSGSWIINVQYFNMPCLIFKITLCTNLTLCPAQQPLAPTLISMSPFATNIIHLSFDLHPKPEWGLKIYISISIYKWSGLTRDSAFSKDQTSGLLTWCRFAPCPSDGNRESPELWGLGNDLSMARCICAATLSYRFGQYLFTRSGEEQVPDAIRSVSGRFKSGEQAALYPPSDEGEPKYLSFDAHRSDGSGGTGDWA